MPRNSTKQDEQSVNVSKSRTLYRLFRYLLDYRGRIVIVFLLMGMTTAISIINPLIIERIINVHIAEGNIKGVISLSILGVLLNITMIMLIKLRMYIMAIISNEVLVKIRQQLYEHIQTLGFKFFDSRPTGKILSRIMGDVNSLKDVLMNSVTTLIPDAITVIAVVVIMLVKNPKLGAASLWSLPIMMIAIFINEGKAHKCWQLFRKKNSNLNAFIHEDVAGIRVIQSLNAEKETEETFDELVNEHRRSFNKACMFSDFLWPIIDLSWSAGLIAMYYMGMVIVGAGQVPVGTLVAFGSYIGMFWQPIMNLSNYFNQMITNVAGAERVFEILDTKPELSDNDDAIIPEDIKGEVCFEDVSFDYDDDDVPVASDIEEDADEGDSDGWSVLRERAALSENRASSETPGSIETHTSSVDSVLFETQASNENYVLPGTSDYLKEVDGIKNSSKTEKNNPHTSVVMAGSETQMCKVLNNVSFKVKPGETVALVGPTGAGKSTIVNLIARFYDVCSGRILIDGNDVRDLNMEFLRSRLGVMTQDNFLFTGTVRENIRYGRLNATDEEIEAAAKAVNAHDFIMKMEKGYDTELKERGAGLSAGQKQLIAFARTFVSNPSILILDEATSSIDTHTEQLVQKGIETLLKGRTSFVIAHRLSTVKNADRIFVVDKGGIVESGSPAELMARKGEYYKLWTAQAAV